MFKFKKPKKSLTSFGLFTLFCEIFIIGNFIWVSNCYCQIFFDYKWKKNEKEHFCVWYAAWSLSKNCYRLVSILYFIENQYKLIPRVSFWLLQDIYNYCWRFWFCGIEEFSWEEALWEYESSRAHEKLKPRRLSSTRTKKIWTLVTKFSSKNILLSLH